MAVGDDVYVDVSGLTDGATRGALAEQPGQRAAAAVAEDQLGGILGTGERQQRLGDVFAEQLVIGPAERLDQKPLGCEGPLVCSGEPVGSGDVDGEQVTAAGPGGDPCGSADQRLAFGATGECDDDSLTGLPRAGDVVLLAVLLSASSTRSAVQSSASSRRALRLPTRK